MTEVMYKGKTGCHPDLEEETHSQQKDVFKGNRLSDSQKNGTFTTEVMYKRQTDCDPLLQKDDTSKTSEIQD